LLLLDEPLNHVDISTQEKQGLPFLCQKKNNPESERLPVGNDSEYRVESGLNCGGHAFVSKANLLAQFLKNFS
jgi:hypothetical protein